MINFYGVGYISTIKQKRGKSPYFIVKLTDHTETEILLHIPYSFKKILKINERIIFEGYLNEDGIVKSNQVSRAYLEPLGFNFVSDNEDIFSFTNKGLMLRIGVKAPKHNLTFKTFEFLAKARNIEVFERLIETLKSKKVSIKGFITNNVGVITSLDKA